MQQTDKKILDFIKGLDDADIIKFLERIYDGGQHDEYLDLYEFDGTVTRIIENFYKE